MDQNKLYKAVESILDEYAGEELTLEQFQALVLQSARPTDEELQSLAQRVVDADTQAIRPLVQGSLHPALQVLESYRPYHDRIGIGGLIFQATEALLNAILMLNASLSPASYLETLEAMTHFMLRDFIVEEAVTYSEADPDMNHLMHDMMHVVAGFPHPMARIFTDYYGMTDDEDDAQLQCYTLEDLALDMGISDSEALRLQQQGLERIFTLLK